MDEGDTPREAKDALAAFMRRNGAVTTEHCRDSRRGKVLESIALLAVGAGVGFVQNAGGADAIAAEFSDVSPDGWAQIGDGQAATTPHERSVSDGMGPDEYAGYVERLQREIDASEFAGRIHVLDASSGDGDKVIAEAMRDARNNRLDRGHGNATAYLAREAVKASSDNWGFSLATTVGGYSAPPDIDADSYHCVALGNKPDAPSFTTVGDDPSVGGLEPAAATVHVLVHEVAHCLTDALHQSEFESLAARAMAEERLADATAALWRLQNGASVDSVERLADIRWHDRVARFEVGEAVKSLLHDSGPALDMVVERAEECRQADWFGNASVVEIAQGPAREIVEKTLEADGLRPGEAADKEGWNEHVQAHARVLEAVKSGDVSGLDGKAADVAARGAKALSELGLAEGHPLAGYGDGRKEEAPKGDTEPRKAPKKAKAILPAAPAQEVRRKLSPAGERAAQAFEERIARHHNNDSISWSVAAFADWAMGQGIDRDVAREAALEGPTVLDGMRGYSFCGVDTPGRTRAKRGFGYAFDRAWEHMNPLHPGVAPEAPQGHEVGRVGDMYVVKDPDGKIGNPEGPAVIAANREEFFLSGERISAEDWTTRAHSAPTA